ncbi:MAG: hypothetical protein ACOY3P_09495 [Planctomycetota bacterium]
MVRTFWICGLMVALLAAALTPAQAAIVSTSNPSLADEIGARIRWGRSGFEASLWDALTFNQSPTLNPVGTPVWQLNVPYNFQVTFDSLTGTLGLSVDFSGDSAFDAGESITRDAFSAPGLSSYEDYGFKYIHISGNEGGSTTRSQVQNLVINGTSLGTLAPNGAFLDTFWSDSSGNPLNSIDITGTLKFTSLGTSDERPSWNFAFMSPQQNSVVPEAGSLVVWSLLGLAAAAGGFRRWRRRK